MKHLGSVLVYLSATLGTAAAFAGAETGPVWWLPPDYSTTGHHYDRLFNIVLYETAVAFAAVVIALVYFAIRYRHREGRRAEYDRGDQPKHIMITLALAMIVFVAIDMNIVHRSNVSIDEIRSGMPDPDDGLVVWVTGEQFNWVVTYPGPDGKFGTIDDVTLRNEMHVPVNTKVLVRLTSRDVIHAFNVPQLRVKMDAVPGMETRVWFEAKEPVELELACAELCGWGHYMMKGRLVIEPREDFERWLKEQEAFLLASSDKGAQSDE